MFFCVLGPLEVYGHHGRPIEIRQRKPRALLSLLLLYAGKWVSTSVIDDALWEGEPPRSAPGNIKTYVSQLRRILAESSDGLDRISSRVGGYRLTAKRHELDVGLFDEAARLGREARERNADAEAVEHFQAALELWRGEPFEDLPLPIRRVETARLDERRWAVCEDLIDAKVALGQHHAVLPDLRALTIEFPMRERLWCQFLLALCRSGRRAEALSAYQSAYRLLADELGIEPGAELQRLHQQMLTGAL